jgi:flagellar operon protein
MSPIEPTNPALIPPGGLTGPAAPTAPAAPGGAQRAETPGGASFADALQQASGLQFSKHALARVERRGIELDAPTLQRLSAGVDRAAGKGARDSLVLVDGTAFVVSVRNHTVITAVDSEHMKDNVFTNIDSAVIA